MNENDQSPPASPAPRRHGPWPLLLLLLLGAVGYYAWSQHAQVATQTEQLVALSTERDAAVTEGARRQAALDEAERQRSAAEAARADLEAQLQTARAEVERLQTAAAQPPAPAPEPVAAPAPAPAPVAAAAAAAAPKPKPAPPKTLTITFDVNSSYFPTSLNGRLRQLATGLDAGQAYAVELTGSVGTDPVENGGPADAAAYNRWIAERRLDRVADFLQDHADGADLTIERSLARKDSSRRVVVSIRPTLP